MTKEELNEFYQSIIDRNSKNKTKAITLLETRKEDVIKLYHEYEAKRIEEYHSRLHELNQITEAWKNKKCIVCGANLRKISSDYGTFWGCPNYKDGRKHTTFPSNYEEILETREEYTKIRIRGNWSTDLTRDLHLPPFVKASDMLNFLERNGLEDLRSKYGYKKSTETIGGYVIAKKASRQEEKEIENFLRPFFQTLLSQVGIRYKLVGQQEKVAIIDLIASNTNNVYIIEVKRESLQIKEALSHKLCK
jgi:ssDNA-binding Zn-finger/Zn-ribbon topoisomerase 1